MTLVTSIKKDFLGLFYPEIECDIPGTHSRLNLRVLRIDNNEFAYQDLIKQLYNNIIHFALSKKDTEEFIRSERYGEMYIAAVEKLRNYHVNDGEAGELLLFCFLEAHLNAPKILTKLQLKTSSNDYVKGSDGIHLLKLSDTEYQIVFGESKLYKSLTTSLTQAFSSINDLITRTDNNIESEIGLINSQLCKEAYDENAYAFIKSIIKPRLTDENPITKDHAFGIFAGFEIEVTEEEKRLSNNDFRALIRKRIINEVESKKEHIAKKIVELGLTNYSFYVYAFPFVDLDENRKKIIEQLTQLK